MLYKFIKFLFFEILAIKIYLQIDRVTYFFNDNTNLIYAFLFEQKCIIFPIFGS